TMITSSRVCLGFVLTGHPFWSAPVSSPGSPGRAGPRGGVTLPSSRQRLVHLDHGRELIPRGRRELQLRAEELALSVEDVELSGESSLVAESGQRERLAGRRRHAALALGADLPHLAAEDQRILDLPEGLLDRLQILRGRLLLARLSGLDAVLDAPRC